MNPPCKDCAFRHLACHDSCSKYLDWKQQRAVMKEQERNRQIEDYLNKQRRRRL